MRRVIALAIGGLLSLCLIAAAGAAPTGRTQGMKNARKAMQGKLEKDKKIQETRKHGQEKKKQARRGA